MKSARRSSTMSTRSIKEIVGMEVKAINVHIQDVAYPPDAAPAKAA